MRNFFNYKNALLTILLAIPFMASAAGAPFFQDWVLNGRVVDEKGDPLTGVSVRVLNTSRGASTDANGRFILQIENENDSLEVSFVGYTTRLIKVGTQREIIIRLQLDAEAGRLGEVVVVGFGTQKKVSVTGAISSITAREMERTSTPSLSNAIAGKLPGIISRQGSGEPGYDAAGIIIRGLGTWVNRSPLILVDGVERDLNNISPQEIESFSVLKDASSTAVYGVRGANGVILINTKRGKPGKPKITLRTELASLTNLRQRDYIGGADYAMLMNEGLINVGKAPRWTAEEIEKYKSGSDPYLYPNVNWIDTVFKKTSYQTINNLSITGGTDVVRYFTNVGYSVQDGIYKEDNFNSYNTNANLKRYNFRSNVDVNLSKSLVVNLSLGGIIDQRNYPGGGADGIFSGATNTSPIAFPVRNPDGSPGGSAVYIGSNPWAQATQTGYSNEKHSTLQGTFGVNYDLSSLVTKGLSFRGKFAYDYYSHNKALRYKIFGVKQYLGKDAVGDDMYSLVREEQPLGYQIIQSATQAIYTEGIINYERKFGAHEVSGMALYNKRDYNNLTAGTSILNLPYRRQGLAGRLSYNYSNKYLLEFNAGYNGSENFPKGKRYGFFPSVSAGWVVSNENFWKLNVVNNLKFRGSYGQVGNDQIGGNRFLFLTTINRNPNNSPYYFGDGQQFWNGITEDQIGVENVTWEVATKANAGFDLEMFGSKLTIQTDFFNERREGILLQRATIPAITGFLPQSIPYGNLGKVKNHGFDALLEARNTTKRGLYYSFRVNYTYAKNKVIENDEPTPLYNYLSGKGQSIDQPYGFIADGFFNAASDISKWADQSALGGTPRPGDIRYVDINGDGKIDTYDQVPIGYARTPQIMYGFGSTVALKGVDASIYFTGAARTSVFLEGRNFYPFNEGSGVFNIFREYYDNRWTPETAETARYPAVSDGNNVINFRRSTVWQRDASYLRLRNAEIGYTLPKPLLNRIKINSVRLFVNGTNLYTWDKLKVIDPESDNAYPIQMIINTGLQVTF